MKTPLRELAEAQAALSGYFEHLWPGLDCPCAESESPSQGGFTELEQRYLRAQRAVQTLKQSMASETGTSGAGSTASGANRTD